MSYSIVQTETDDARDRVLAVWRDAFPHLDGARFSWAYELNPAGPALCWLAHLEGTPSTTIGTAALVKRRYWTGTEHVTVGISADFAVSNEHRGFGPALGLQREAASVVEAGQLAFAYGLPNSKASSLIRRVGFRPVGKLAEYVMPLRTQSALAPILGRGAAATVAPLLDSALSARRYVRSLFRPSDGNPVDDRSFDGRFDDLWSHVARSSSVIIGERNAEFLRWRFSYPAGKYRTFVLGHRQTGALQGYVVYTSENGSTSIVDMLCRDMQNGAEPLLSQFASARRAAGDATIRINLLAPRHFVTALRATGFRHRGDTMTLMVYVAKNSALVDRIYSPEQWFLTLADNDV